MKTKNIIFSVAFVICSFIVLQTYNSNIILTDFTKELITMYINDSENINAKKRRYEMIVNTYTDTTGYYIKIHSNDKMFRYFQDDFVGQVLYSGKRVKVFGDANSVFYTTKGKARILKRLNNKLISIIFYRNLYANDDPLVWTVCIYKDLSFCKMRTSKPTIGGGDISLIQNLAAKYFKIPDAVPEYDNYIYQWWNVEVPPKLLLDDDSISHFIASNFRVKEDMNFDKVGDFVVDILIDKNGNATPLKGIDYSSGDVEIDNEAIRVVEKIYNTYKYRFIPAMHRGEKVNSYYQVVFYKNEIAPRK